MSTHGGNIYKFIRESEFERDDVIDFSASINPYGPPPEIRSIISSSIQDIIHYPDPEYLELKETIAVSYKVPLETVVVGNGTTEILYSLLKVLQPKRVVIPVPSYIDYQKVVELEGLDILFFTLDPKKDFVLNFSELEDCLLSGDTVIIGSPNNPTGQCVGAKKIQALAEKRPDVTFVIDEAFLDFIVDGESVAGSAINIITLNSLTKFYSIPGLRLGFGVFPVELSNQINKTLPPWSINTIANAVGIHCLTNKSFKDDSLKKITREIDRFRKILEEIKSIKVYPSSVNYFLVKNLRETSSYKLINYLAERGLIIRGCGNFNSLDESFFRVAVKSPEDNDKLAHSIFYYFSETKKSRKGKKTANLMFQGTCSNAGKSILTSALCRILLEDGVKVAPFKAQNMSLNSFVTGGGGEMGRAQVVQAQAAKVDPDVRMNPILLKPNSDTGSQIIVQGKAIGNMNVSQYTRYKEEFGWDIVKENYDSLAADYDAIILEGAGSPGEVNLKSHDIVNMRMAGYAKSPVMLVGDIDRGGVYASFIGTMEVLEEWERRLIQGFIVNKFRGQADLLQSAHDYVFNYTCKEVHGVVPYLTGLTLPEEDSVSFKNGYIENDRPLEPFIDMVVISLPHISNFTDIEPFYNEPDVYVRVIEDVSEFGNPDVVIIPGSKNVFSDLKFLRKSGFDRRIIECSKKGCDVVGICGGFIQLGCQIKDPHNIETSPETSDIFGLGILPIKTVLAEDKSLFRKSGIHAKSGKKITGYEIHHGISDEGLNPVLNFEDGTSCGVSNEKGNVWGAYLHGIFDEDEFRRYYIDSVRIKKGFSCTGEVVAPYDIESSFSMLADTVRQSLDMDQIYKMMGL